MTMAAATAFVLISANVIVSLIRGLLKPHLRILVFTLTIATFVTIADRVLAAYMYEMSKQLGPYVPLIIVNCLIISPLRDLRVEADGGRGACRRAWACRWASRWRWPASPRCARSSARAPGSACR